MRKTPVTEDAVAKMKMLHELEIPSSQIAKITSYAYSTVSALAKHGFDIEAYRTWCRGRSAESREKRRAGKRFTIKEVVKAKETNKTVSLLIEIRDILLRMEEGRKGIFR